jgi:hypothetical protein
MVDKKKKKRQRGLSAIAGARDERSRGGVQWTTQMGLAGAAVVVGGLIAYKVVGDRELNVGRNELLGKQRAVAVTLGAEWTPLRDKVEGDVLGASGPFAGDDVEPEARKWEFKTQPGLYLRIRVADAKDAKQVRKAAADAKRDAFAACLLREPNDPVARGEADASAVAEQPWNLGRAYTATRILTDEWVQEVKDADDDMRLRVFQQQYDHAVKGEIPVAIDVVKRAQFFLLVLDEDVPEAARLAEGGGIDEEALQLVAHPSRVHLFDLRSGREGREMVRLRRTGDGRFIPAGERMVTDPEMRDAMQRQANNCALARSVDDALAPPATANAGSDGGK